LLQSSVCVEGPASFNYPINEPARAALHDGEPVKHLACRTAATARREHAHAPAPLVALASLEDRSCKPQRTCQPTWAPALPAAVRQEPERYSCWGKEKIAIMVPHQALAYATPVAWLQDRQKQKTDRSQLAEARLPLPEADSTIGRTANV